MMKYIALVGDHNSGDLFSGILVAAANQTPDERFEEYIQLRTRELEDEEFLRKYYSFFEVDSTLGEKIVSAAGEARQLKSPQESSEAYHGGYGEGTLAVVKLFKVE